jgi:hemolysin III
MDLLRFSCQTGVMIDMSYPDYSRAERMADGAIHIVGLLAAIAGVSVLFAMWALRMDGVTLASTIVYSGALILMLAASATYHLAAHTTARPILRRLDHAAIYLKIAGTFTPLIGATAKLLAKPGQMTTGWLPYVALGWFGVALFVPLMDILPGTSLGLMLAGGLLYTAGVVFYAWEGLRFANAIWHLFVAAASACFFLGISGALATTL